MNIITFHSLTMKKEDQEKEKFSLTWHTYSDHFRGMMKELLENDDFSDITLVTEDKKEIKANINILSSCSPVFKDILKKEKNSSQIMYLRGIKYSELKPIMQFIYLGEARFHEERMKEFFEVARSLEIKDLCNAENESTNVNFTRATSKFDCEDCPKTYTLIHHLRRHRESTHEGVQYPCELCDFKATRFDSLTIHIRGQHKGLKFTCHKCGAKATTKSNLNMHIQKMHEGAWYACNHCNYEDANHKGIRLHIKNEHNGVPHSSYQYKRALESV